MLFVSYHTRALNKQLHLNRHCAWSLPQRLWLHCVMALHAGRCARPACSPTCCVEQLPLLVLRTRRQLVLLAAVWNTPERMQLYVHGA